MTRKVFDIPVRDTVPPIRAIFEGQGIPHWAQPDDRTRRLADEAISLYEEHAAPAGIVMDIGKGMFRSVFEGEGLNEDESPVRPVYEASDHLALFAVTIGEQVCRDISEKFRLNDFALGSMLDSTASESAEMAAAAAENAYRAYLTAAGLFDHGQGILRFSPGFCGWHITAQKKLFEVLKPDRIGITLNDSCLMQPLKSVSGVIIAGNREIFRFDDTFSFCRSCATHTCQDRIRSLFEQ